MKTNISRSVIDVTITLDEEEARLLRELVQNPQHPPDEEPPEISKLRRDIFEALDPAKFV